MFLLIVNKICLWFCSDSFWRPYDIKVSYGRSNFNLIYQIWMTVSNHNVAYKLIQRCVHFRCISQFTDLFTRSSILTCYTTCHKRNLIMSESQVTEWWIFRRNIIPQQYDYPYIGYNRTIRITRNPVSQFN